MAAVSNCQKCGTKIKSRPVRKLMADSVVQQSAQVQFRRRVDVVVKSEGVTFFPGQIIAVDFSILKAILSDQSDSARFLSATEKAEFLLTYHEFEGVL